MRVHDRITVVLVLVDRHRPTRSWSVKKTSLGCPTKKTALQPGAGLREKIAPAAVDCGATPSAWVFDMPKRLVCPAKGISCLAHVPMHCSNEASSCSRRRTLYDLGWHGRRRGRSLARARMSTSGEGSYNNTMAKLRSTSVVRPDTYPGLLLVRSRGLGLWLVLTCFRGPVG